MALPKDITSSINTTPVYGAIAEATADPAQDAQEALLLREEPQEPQQEPARRGKSLDESRTDNLYTKEKS